MWNLSSLISRGLKELWSWEVRRKSLRAEEGNGCHLAAHVVSRSWGVWALSAPVPTSDLRNTLVVPTSFRDVWEHISLLVLATPLCNNVKCYSALLSQLFYFILFITLKSCWYLLPSVASSPIIYLKILKWNSAFSLPNTHSFWSLTLQLVR